MRLDFRQPGDRQHFGGARVELLTAPHCRMGRNFERWVNGRWQRLGTWADPMRDLAESAQFEYGIGSTLVLVASEGETKP